MAHRFVRPSVTLRVRAVPAAARGAGMSFPDRDEIGPAPALIEETQAINAATGDQPAVHPSLVVAVWGGQAPRVEELLRAGIVDDGTGSAGPVAGYAGAVLYNGLGQYPAAIDAATRACAYERSGLFTWSLAELVEAAVRGGRRRTATDALRRLEDATPARGTDWALGMRARSRALLAARDTADAYFQEALERLAASRIALHLARCQLLYGEWLRREGRRVHARRQLRSAHGFLRSVGAAGYAERTRRELLASGETTHREEPGAAPRLTPQEAQIARMASTGDTNLEIANQLFISPRTVEWHLKKVFTKLDIRSRRQLRTALPPAEPIPAGV
jgi:DNA-binding CsgD family transcriptional regulator